VVLGAILEGEIMYLFLGILFVILFIISARKAVYGFQKQVETIVYHEEND
jgi:hypothetical protein